MALRTQARLEEELEALHQQRPQEISEQQRDAYHRERFLGVEPARHANQGLREFEVDAPVARFV
jgi:hypothetical protein